MKKNIQKLKKNKHEDIEQTFVLYIAFSKTQSLTQPTIFLANTDLSYFIEQHSTSNFQLKYSYIIVMYN